MAHNQVVVGSNPGTIYWMDVSYYIKKMEIKVAKWGALNIQKNSLKTYFGCECSPMTAWCWLSHCPDLNWSQLSQKRAVIGRAVIVLVVSGRFVVGRIIIEWVVVRLAVIEWTFIGWVFEGLLVNKLVVVWRVVKSRVVLGRIVNGRVVRIVKEWVVVGLLVNK